VSWWVMASIAALRVGLAGFVMIFLFPRLLLPDRQAWTSADRWAASGMLGLLLVEVVGHLLIPLRMFEMLGFALVLFSLVLLFRWRLGGIPAVRAFVEDPLHQLFSWLDVMTDSEPTMWKERAKRLFIFSPIKFSTKGCVEALLGLSILVVAVVTRLGDALTQAGPVSSDYLEHLQWSSWLASSKLGLMTQYVYPRGMNMLHAALRFFTQEELHLATRTAGPMFNLLTLAGIWYVVRAATGSRFGALVAAALYAGAPVWLPAGWARQSAPLPQEFAMVLLLPAAWWGYRYLDRRDRLDLVLAGGATLVVAASHWIVLVYLAVLFVCVTVIRPDRFREAVTLGFYVGVAAVLGLAPQAIGLLQGVPIFSTAMDFVAGTTVQSTGSIGMWALLAVTAGLVAGLIGTRREPVRRVLPAVLLGFLFMHLLPLVGVNSPAFSARSWDFLAIAVAGGVGAAFAGIEWLGARRLAPALSTGLAVVLVGAFWISSPPRVLRLEPELTHEYTLQILRLKRELEYGQWMVIGRGEQLALALPGSQTDGSRFARVVAVPPRGVTAAQVVAKSELERAGTLATEVPDLLFFVEPKPFISTVSNGTENKAKVLRDNQAVIDWIASYSETHNEPEIIYHSPTLIIYRIITLRG
jgi:hypothetical protein